MKKQHISLLVVITAVFAAFLLGFFYGKQISSAPVQVSAVISDGPTEITTTPTETTVFAADSVIFPININTATAEELTALPGIGEVLAGRIVDHRSANGEFTIIEELMDVSGISEKRFEAIKDFVTTGG